MWILFFTGAWFWILTVAIAVLLIWEVARDKAIAAGFTVALYILAIHLFGNAAMFSFLRANPEWVYIGVPAFFVAGSLWALIKWWFHVRRKALEYREQRMEWLISQGITDATLDTPVPDALKDRGFKRSRKPLARQNKGRIITWMVYWPFSMAWTVLDEPWRLIYEAMARLFQRIADHAFADLDKDIPDTDPAERDEG